MTFDDVVSVTYVVGYPAHDLGTAIEPNFFSTHVLERDAPVLVMRLDDRMIRGIELEFFQEVRLTRLARPSVLPTAFRLRREGVPVGEFAKLHLPTTSPTFASVTFGVNLNPLCGPRQKTNTHMEI